MEHKIIFIKLDPKTEADIICWMKSLPPRTVNKTVNEILVAESNGRIAGIPYEFSCTSKEEPLRCRLIFRSEVTLNFLGKISKGEYKETLVKIIRRHIESNEKLPSALIEVNRKYFSIATDRFIESVKNKKIETKGLPNRYDKLVTPIM